ncbi:MAG TPA: hypothetical protein VK982_16050 [Bacteroidales bacterium]|nr:hypothetical protein [Bacteroidales bacterium]
MFDFKSFEELPTNSSNCQAKRNTDCYKLQREIADRYPLLKSISYTNTANQLELVNYINLKYRDLQQQKLPATGTEG